MNGKTNRSSRTMDSETLTFGLSAINLLNDKDMVQERREGMSFNRREMLRLGACGATAAIISTAASSSVLPSLIA